MVHLIPSIGPAAITRFFSSSQWWRRLLAALTFLAWASGYGCASGHVGSENRGPLEPIQTQELFEGVTYVPVVFTQPRPVRVHVVVVELAARGISFLVTPPTPGGELPLAARTTSAFLEEFDLQVAVNANFFTPFRSGIFGYYPHEGDRVGVLGLAASRGDVYSPAERGYTSLVLSRSHRASFGRAAGDLWNVISGRELIVRNRVVRERFSPLSHAHEPNPRTVVALDDRRAKLFLAVADGRQRGYSEGMTLPELGRVLVALGASDVLHFDGGGSTTLVVEGDGGRAKVLNNPIHRRSPGKQRPVANHLGVYARKLGRESSTRRGARARSSTH